MRLWSILLIALCGCSTVDKRTPLTQQPPPDEQPPIPQFKADPTQRAVVFPEVESRTVAFAHSDPTASFTFYYGWWGEASVTNDFGSTTNRAITTDVLRPPNAENFYVRGQTIDILGRHSELSYIERDPPYPFNAAVLSCEPAISVPVMVWESSNGTHWVGYYTKLPSTNALNGTRFYRVFPTIIATNIDGIVPATPITLNLELRREWNEVLKRFGK